MEDLKKVDNFTLVFLFNNLNNIDNEERRSLIFDEAVYRQNDSQGFDIFKENKSYEVMLTLLRKVDPHRVKFYLYGKVTNILYAIHSLLKSSLKDQVIEDKEVSENIRVILAGVERNMIVANSYDLACKDMVLTLKKIFEDCRRTSSAESFLTEIFENIESLTEKDMDHLLNNRNNYPDSARERIIGIGLEKFQSKTKHIAPYHCFMYLLKHKNFCLTMSNLISPALDEIKKNDELLLDFILHVKEWFYSLDGANDALWANLYESLKNECFELRSNFEVCDLNKNLKSAIAFLDSRSALSISSFNGMEMEYCNPDNAQIPNMKYEMYKGTIVCSVSAVFNNARCGVLDTLASLNKRIERVGIFDCHGELVDIEFRYKNVNLEKDIVQLKANIQSFFEKIKRLQLDLDVRSFKYNLFYTSIDRGINSLLNRIIVEKLRDGSESGKMYHHILISDDLNSFLKSGDLFHEALRLSIADADFVDDETFFTTLHRCTGWDNAHEPLLDEIMGKAKKERADFHLIYSIFGGKDNALAHVIRYYRMAAGNYCNYIKAV